MLIWGRSTNLTFGSTSEGAWLGMMSGRMGGFVWEGGGLQLRSAWSGRPEEWRSERDRERERRVRVRVVPSAV